MGIFSGKKTYNVTANTETIVTVNPDISIDFDLDKAGDQISTVIREQSTKFNGTLDKTLKTVSAIAVLWVVSKSI